MAGIVGIKERLRHGDFAHPRLLQRNQRQWSVQKYGDIPRNLILAPVLIGVGGFQLQQGNMEAITGKEALTQTVPVSKLNKTRIGEPALESKRPLSFFGERECHLVARK